MDEKCKSKSNVLEQIYVHDVYSRLGSTNFSQENLAWPNVRKFLSQIVTQNRHALVADVGCGTGKYLKLKKDLFTVGCDRSEQLCETALEKFSPVPIVIADNLYLPYRDNIFDAVLSIGVIHHLSTHQRRLRAVQECLRILKPEGGRLLIYTWAFEQKHRKFSSQDVLVPCSTAHIRSDIIVDDRSYLSKCDLNEKLRRQLEEKEDEGSNFSMIQSIQNLFQRWIKTPSESLPSTNNLSHSDKINFRIRPFPMSSFDHQNSTINPNNKRFYHVFKSGELENLVEEASKMILGTKILHSFYDHGNWCVVVGKDSNSVEPSKKIL